VYDGRPGRAQDVDVIVGLLERGGRTSRAFDRERTGSLTGSLNRLTYPGCAQAAPDGGQTGVRRAPCDKKKALTRGPCVSNIRYMSNIRTNDVEHLASMFKALSSPQRLRMFIKLATTCCSTAGTGASGTRASFCCAGELGEDLQLAPSTVSHHLKELRQAGLVQVERRGQRIDCRVGPDTLRLLASFFGERGPVRPAGDATVIPVREVAKGGRRS
jgi:ArsR family transcriptional regulator